MKGLKNSFAALAGVAVISATPLQANESGFNRSGVVHNVPEPQYPTALFLAMGLAGLWVFKKLIDNPQERPRVSPPPLPKDVNPPPGFRP